MKTVIVTAPDSVTVTERPVPAVGPRDVLVRVRACGVCGSDAMYVHMGGLENCRGDMPLGHEIAGEIVEVGSQNTHARIGDHVVVNPMANEDGIIGNGGRQGGLSEYVLLPNAEAGVNFRVIPAHIPWTVAALNEPMAVAYHGVNRSGAGEGTQAVVFGAGPVGLGAALAFKAKGAAHVTVVDVVPNRLEKALLIGADAVINSASEDVLAQLKELHGEVPGFGGLPSRPATDVYLDAAGVPAVIKTALAGIKHGGVLTVVGVHKQPVEIDLQALLPSEPDIRLAMGYPTEFFEVTDAIIDNWQNYQHIISDVIPFTDVEEAIALASTPGAADKVVVSFD